MIVGKDSVVNKQISEFENTGGYEKLLLKQRENLWWNAAFENIKQHPAIFIKMFFYKIWDFWRPYLNPVSYSQKTVLVSGVYFFTLYILGILGLFTVFKTENSKFTLLMLAVLAVSVTLLHAVFFATIRYRLPYIDPYLCGFGGIGLLKIFSLLLEKFRANKQ